ncbi:hypothetical protein J1N35_018043, partial [Gossypium stocksii]
MSKEVAKQQALLNTTVAKLTEKNETLEDIMIAIKADNEATVVELHTKIEELEGELAFCHVTMGKRVLGGTPSHKVDTPKPKKFKGARSIRKVDNLWEIEQYFHAIGTKEDDAKFYLEYINKEAWAKLRQFSQQGTIKEYVKQFSELMLQIINLSEDEAFFLFMDRLKSWV